ncbi:MAG: lysine--tRNA ligase, partial [bacterium]
EDRERARVRAKCAWHWIQHYAPEEFRFTLRSSSDSPVSLESAERDALLALAAEVDRRFDEHDEKSLQTAVYDTARAHGLEPADFFTVLYRVLIGKDKGPRLAGFLKTLGRETVLDILSPYMERGE